MLVTSLGHAGLRVETANSSILIDPWFAPDGAFLGSWFPYPDNAHVLPLARQRPSAIVISHEHLDHLDPWILAQVPGDVPVVICRYPSPVLRDKLDAAGRRHVIEVAPWERVEIGNGSRVFFVSEESPMNHDSAIVVEGDGSSLLNLNDARLSASQLRAVRAELGGTVDILTLQGAGASWYPICYRYPEERRRILSAQKREAKFGYLARAVTIVEPSVAVPFAGPPCFLDPQLAQHNHEMDGGIFPDQADTERWMRSKGLGNIAVLLPGESWDTAGIAKLSDPHWKDFSFSDRSAYLDAYSHRRGPALQALFARYPSPTGSLWDEFYNFFAELVEMSPYFDQKIDMRVAFDVVGPGGGNWAVDFRPESLGVYDEPGDWSYRYCFESRWLSPIVAKLLPWEDFLLSLRFEAERDPDVYNDHLLGLLKFATPSALLAVETFERSMDNRETTTIRAQGQTYRIQRRCPHAGQDLAETGQVLDGGVLRCLGHHYEFDLETGACLNGNCTPLFTERLSAGDDNGG